jgi:phosphoglycerate dehydrogenase-like enzyme
MNIISNVRLGEELFLKMKSEFPDYQYFKGLGELDKNDLEAIEVLVTYGGDITSDKIDEMKNLKWIHVMQSGIDSLPFKSLIERDILLTNSKGINSITIAEYLMSMMLSLVRNSFVFYDAQRRKEWDFNTKVDELAGKTLGILGYGAVGKELAKRAKAFDMKVIAYKRTPIENPDNVDELISINEKQRIFKESDFLISLLPLTPQTKGFIGLIELEEMKETSYIINVSRGEVVDQQALIKVINGKQLAGAVLDVFEEEPLSGENELWGIENIYITPHIAGDRHPTYKKRAFDILMNNLQIYHLNPDEMVNIVNKNQGY